MPKPTEPFFEKPRSPEEIAAFFGCTPKFVYKQIHEGLLRGRKFSDRMIRVLPRDLEAWLERASTVSEA